MPAKEIIVHNAVKIDHLDQLPSRLLPLISPYNIVLIGETHGTKECPSFCLGLIKLLATDSKTPVVLALEISGAEQPIFDEFMRTGNSDVFAKSPLFTDKQPYGISSEAMVQLLTSLRHIDNVTVHCALSKDSPSKATFQENQEDRDFMWASSILQKLCSKEKPRIVALGGDNHMSLIPQLLATVSVKTMGYYLLHSEACPMTTEQVISIMIRSKEVNAWACFADAWDNINVAPITRCGEMKVSNIDDNYSTALDWESYFLMEPSMQAGYNATLFIRNLSLSKPFN